MKKVGCTFCEMAVRRKSEMPEVIARLVAVIESLSQFYGVWQVYCLCRYEQCAVGDSGPLSWLVKRSQIIK